MTRVAAYVVLILLAFIFASLSPGLQVRMSVRGDAIPDLAETLAGYDSRTPAGRVPIIRGRDVYLAACTQCHGRNNRHLEIGSGRPRAPHYYSPRDVHQLITWGQGVRVPGNLEHTGEAFQLSGEHPIFRTGLTESERWAVSLYLNSSWLDPGNGADDESWLIGWRVKLEGEAGDTESGPGLYQDLCSTCHGLTGYGNGPLAENLVPPPRNLRDTVWLAGQSDAYIYSVIRHGRLMYAMEEAEFALPEPWSGMPAWGGYLDDVAILRLANYIRGFNYTLDGEKAGMSLEVNDEGEYIRVEPDTCEFDWTGIRRLIPEAPIEPPEWYDR